MCGRGFEGVVEKISHCGNCVALSCGTWHRPLYLFSHQIRARGSRVPRTRQMIRMVFALVPWGYGSPQWGQKSGASESFLQTRHCMPDSIGESFLIGYQEFVHSCTRPEHVRIRLFEGPPKDATPKIAEILTRLHFIFVQLFFDQ